MTDPLNIYGLNIVFEIDNVKYDSIKITDIADFKDEQGWKDLMSNPLFAHDSKMRESRHKLEATTINNLSIQTPNGSEDVLQIRGHVFLIDLNQSYFHAMYDNFGQFLILKNYFPDIQPVFINTENKFDLNLINDYKKSIIRMANIKNSSIINGTIYKNIIIEKLTVIHANTSTFLRAVRHKLNQQENLVDKYLHSDVSSAALLYNTSKHLKKFFDSYNVEDMPTERNKKIYLSRMSSRELFERTMILKKLLLQNGVSWAANGAMIDSNNFVLNTNLEAFAPASIFGPIAEIDYRYLSIQDELMIENFFKDRGYEIIDTSEKTFLQQLKLFRSCSHIATLAGAGSMNSLFLGDSGTIIYINPDTGYNFYHEDIIDTITKNSIILMDRRRNRFARGKMSVKSILQKLETEYKDRI